LDRYDVFAVVPVRADLRVYLMSGSYERGTQDIALAAVRTIVVSAASRPHGLTSNYDCFDPWCRQYLAEAVDDVPVAATFGEVHVADPDRIPGCRTSEASC